MKIRNAILAAGALALAAAVPATLAQQGQTGGGVPDRKSSAAKAKTQATVQGPAQGPQGGQAKTASKKGAQATVQGGGQGGQGGGQLKSQAHKGNLKSGTQATVQGGGQGGQGGGQLKSGSMSKGAAIKDTAKGMK